MKKTLSRIKNQLKKRKWLRKLVIQCRTLIEYAFGNKNKTLDEKIPWIGKEAIEWLKQYLKNDMLVFEWGSGGSTLFMAPKVKEITSIEHNYDWFLKTQVYLKLNRVKNCRYDFAPPETGNKIKYGSTDKNYLSYNFERYCKTIDTFPEKRFDLIFIDGRARSSCILHARDKVKIGGCILLDNSKRKEYLNGIELLNDWKRTDFGELESTTSVFQRIK